MGQSKRRQFTPECKVQAVKLVVDGGHSIRQIAADLGVCESLLRRWRREGKEVASSAPTGAAVVAAASSLDEEVRRLRRENERLRQERDILKKAVAIFSQGPT